MTTPLYRSNGAGVQSASAATLTPTLPTTLDTGANGRYLAVCISNNNAVHSTATTGWTKLGQVNSGASLTVSVFYASQGAAAPVITWSGAAGCAAYIAYYTDPDGVIDTPLLAISNTGTGSPHTLGSFTTARAHSLAVEIDISAATANAAVPSGWTSDVNTSFSTAVVASRHNSKPMDASGATGAISTTTTATTAAWVTIGIELQRKLAVGALEVSKQELGAWVEPPKNQLAAAKLETGLWLIPNDNQLRASKMEVGFWLVKAPITRRPHLLFSSF